MLEPHAWSDRRISTQLPIDTRINTSYTSSTYVSSPTSPLVPTPAYTITPILSSMLAPVSPSVAAAVPGVEAQANIDSIHMDNKGFGHGGEGIDCGHVRSEVRRIEEGHVRQGRSLTVKAAHEETSGKLIEVARAFPVVSLSCKAASGRHVDVGVEGRPSQSGHVGS